MPDSGTNRRVVVTGTGVVTPIGQTVAPTGFDAFPQLKEAIDNLDKGAIKPADVVYVLRMQKERMLEGANYVPSLREYAACWGVTADRVRPGQKIMHPGPMNRGVEIDAEVADAAESLIERQVRSGLVVRMAVLYDLLTHGPVEVKVAEMEEVA
jgi:aspartate carbamoyltransferase catalytic subunit